MLKHVCGSSLMCEVSSVQLLQLMMMKLMMLHELMNGSGCSLEAFSTS